MIGGINHYSFQKKSVIHIFFLSIDITKYNIV